MTNKSLIAPLKVLHVLTFSGNHGEYGGPNRVARELCLELQKRGYSVKILYGTQVGMEPEIDHSLQEMSVYVKPILKKFWLSTLWSWKLPNELRKEIFSSDLVHVHFARDLIPLLTVAICRLSRTPYVLQTHGMVIPDRRFLIRFLDLLLIRPAFSNSKANLALSIKESQDLRAVSDKIDTSILPNGIWVRDTPVHVLKRKNLRVIFCSRIHGRKRPDRFVELAAYSQGRASNINFEIFGPDGGDLQKVQLSIANRNLNNLKYSGQLQHEYVGRELLNSDLMILPSEDEPFPMIVLESLAQGTPVIVMPSCEIAGILGATYPQMVAPTDDFEGLIQAFLMMQSLDFMRSHRVSIIQFCEKSFGIATTVNSLERHYATAIL